MGAFSNILLETFVPNLVSVTLTPVSRYWAKLRWVYFRILGQSLIKANCHNSRTSDIEMKLGPASKLDKRNKTTSKNWRWHRDGKLWCYCHFSDFWPTWSNIALSKGTVIAKKMLIFCKKMLTSAKLMGRWC